MQTNSVVSECSRPGRFFGSSVWWVEPPAPALSICWFCRQISRSLSRAALRISSRWRAAKHPQCAVTGHLRLRQNLSDTPAQISLSIELTILPNHLSELAFPRRPPHPRSPSFCAWLCFWAAFGGSPRGYGWAFYGTSRRRHDGPEELRCLDPHHSQDPLWDGNGHKRDGKLCGRQASLQVWACERLRLHLHRHFHRLRMPMSRPNCL